MTKNLPAMWDAHPVSKRVSVPYTKCISVNKTDYVGDCTWCGVGSSNLTGHSRTCGDLKMRTLDSSFRNLIPVLLGNFEICFLFNTVVSNQG